MFDSDRNVIVPECKHLAERNIESEDIDHLGPLKTLRLDLRHLQIEKPRSLREAIKSLLKRLIRVRISFLRKRSTGYVLAAACFLVAATACQDIPYGTSNNETTPPTKESVAEPTADPSLEVDPPEVVGPSNPKTIKSDPSPTTDSSLEVDPPEPTETTKPTEPKSEPVPTIDSSLAVDPPEVTKPSNPSKPSKPVPTPETKPTAEPVKPVVDEVAAAAERDFLRSLTASGGEIDRALFWLINQNKPNALKLAKLKGANINGVNRDGDRPLCMAIEKNNQELVNVLIEEGAELNYISSDFRTPLARAAFNGSANIIKMLVNAGIDVNSAPDGLLPALHMAARNDQVSAIDALVSLNANVNLYSNGATAAHEAVMWEQPNALRALLDRGANPHLRNAKGKTLFDLVDSHPKSPKYEHLKEILSSYR